MTTINDVLSALHSEVSKKYRQSRIQKPKFQHGVKHAQELNLTVSREQVYLLLT